MCQINLSFLNQASNGVTLKVQLSEPKPHSLYTVVYLIPYSWTRVARRVGRSMVIGTSPLLVRNWVIMRNVFRFCTWKEWARSRRSSTWRRWSWLRTWYSAFPSGSRRVTSVSIAEENQSWTPRSWAIRNFDPKSRLSSFSTANCFTRGMFHLAESLKTEAQSSEERVWLVIWSLKVGLGICDEDKQTYLRKK